MNCPNCSKLNSEDSAFCKFCGHSIDQKQAVVSKKKLWEKTWFRVLVAIVVGFVMLSIFPGLFYTLLFVYGFYTFLYLLSLFFKSTQPLAFVISTVMFLFTASGYLGVLYLYYVALKMIFEGAFFWGILLLIFGIPLISFVPMAINLFFGFIAIGPGYFFLEDLERRSNKSIY